MQRLAVALVLLPLLAACSGTDEANLAMSVPAPASPAPLTTSVREAPPRSGPVGDGGVAASCVQRYTATAIGSRAFAFDGTVVAIGPGRTNKPGMGDLPTAAVTFRVHEWFRGGTDATVTVDMVPPGMSVAPDPRPTYEKGTRLLVSGEPRWGGEPLADAIAWSCGFSRYYEAAVAAEWRGAAS